MNITDCYEKIDSEFGFVLDIFGLKLDTQECKSNGLNSVDYLVTSQYNQGNIDELESDSILFIEFSNLKAQIDNFNSNPFHAFHGKKINKLKNYIDKDDNNEELCQKLKELLNSAKNQAKDNYMIYALTNELKDKILSTVFSLKESINFTSASTKYCVIYKIENYSDTFALQSIMSNEKGVLHSIKSSFQKSINIELIAVQNADDISTKIKEHFDSIAIA